MEVLAALDQLDTQNLRQAAATELRPPPAPAPQEPVRDAPTLDLTTPVPSQFTVSEEQLGMLSSLPAHSLADAARVLFKN